MKDTDQDPGGAPDAAPTRGPRRTAMYAALGATSAAVVVLFALSRHIAFLVDDAFITFRFSRNWSEWGAPVFNAFELGPEGQPVEGFSNFLWTSLLALLHGVGASLPDAVGPLQFGLGAVTLMIIGRFAHARLRLGVIGVAAAPLLLASAAPFVAWTSGGMETSLFTLLVTAFMCEALHRDGDDFRRGLGLGLLGAGVVLVRVEGLLWVAGVLVAVAAAEALRSGQGLRAFTQHKQRLLVALVIIGLVVLGQVVWRQMLYGSFLPNTVAAKTGGGTGVMARGLRQVASWALVTITPLTALVLALPALRHRAPRAGVAAAAALLSTGGFVAYNVLVGGDWMPFFRFLAPAAPALALLVAIGLDSVPARAGLAACAALIVLQPLSLLDVHVVPERARAALRFRSFKGGYRSEAARVETARINEAYFSRLGHALAVGTSKGDVLAFGAIGSPGWFAPELDFVDRNGLVTPAVAARAVKPGGGTAGHEKRVPHAWFLDAGSPAPNLLFATWREGVFLHDDPGSMAAAKASVRTSGMTALPAERELFERTVLTLKPITEGPGAGCTLLLLERADPAVARSFWAR